MDELDLLTRHRPDPAPPTPAERATARAALMAHVAGARPGAPADGTAARTAAGATDDRTATGARTRADDRTATGAGTGGARLGADGHRPVVDLASSPRRNRRTVRRAVALAGAAAAVLAGVLVAGGSDHAPEPLRDRPATAAEQLRSIAGSVDPYPDLPYAVPVQVTYTISGEGGPETSEAIVHRAAPGVWITEAPGCADPCDAASTDGVEPLPFPTDADAATVRAALDAEVQERLGPPTPEGPGPDVAAQFRTYLIGSLLQHPDATSDVRAELMRVLAEVPGLTATPDARSALGATGTEFALTGAQGEETVVLLDPSDGFVLELRRTSVADDPIDPAEASAVTSFGRPSAGPLPEAVATVAAAVAEAGPTVDLGEGTGPVCAFGTGPMAAEEDLLLGVAVPDGLSYTYCPTS